MLSEFYSLCYNCPILTYGSSGFAALKTPELRSVAKVGERASIERYRLRLFIFLSVISGWQIPLQQLSEVLTSLSSFGVNFSSNAEEEPVWTRPRGEKKTQSRSAPRRFHFNSSQGLPFRARRPGVSPPTGPFPTRVPPPLPLTPSFMTLAALRAPPRPLTVARPFTFERKRPLGWGVGVCGVFPPSRACAARRGAVESGGARARRFEGGGGLAVRSPVREGRRRVAVLWRCPGGGGEERCAAEEGAPR